MTAAEETKLAAAGVAVRRHPIIELIGERGRLETMRLADGEVDGGFVRPEWDAGLAFLDGVSPARDDDGHLLTDRSGRTDVP